MPLIEPGSPAPSFRLPDAAGTVHTLASLKGKTVVLYFYPKDDTSGCTLEACDFRDLLPKFTGAKAVVLGVSPDGVASHAKFARKHGLDFTLLADEPGKDGTPATCAAYGTWQEKSMYGRKYFGVVRTTYLIGPDGKVRRRWDKVSVPGHAAEVLAAIGGAAAPAPRPAKAAAPRKKVAKAARAASKRKPRG
jgi:peroxiredoxin Q/BCP